MAYIASNTIKFVKRYSGGSNIDRIKDAKNDGDWAAICYAAGRGTEHHKVQEDG